MTTLALSLRLNLRQNMIKWGGRLARKTYIQGFDVENRLTVTVSSGVPITTTFAYDATGQRRNGLIIEMPKDPIINCY